MLTDIRAAHRLLGSSLLFDFDARHGANPTAVTWADHVRTMTLTGTNTPTFGNDPGFFNNRSVWKFLAASTQYMDTGTLGATLIATGASGMYGSMVVRASLITDLSATQLFGSYRSDAGTVLMSVQRISGATASVRGFLVGNNANNALDIGLTPRLLEVYLDATGRRYFAIDGVDVSDLATTGLTATANLTRLTLGATNAGATPSNMNIARVRLCSAVPSLSIRTSLRQIDHLVWGTAA